MNGSSNRLGLIAMISAVALIAYQIGGKATRDALFFSSFDVTALPTMLIAASAVSLVVVLAAARILTAMGPARLVPLAFAGSAILTLAEWGLTFVNPKVAAVVIYLHIAAFGAVLISGFWSMLNEIFDPHTGRRQIGRVAAGGSLGGLFGGVLAGQLGSTLGVSTVLPGLAVLHLVCAFFALRLARHQRPEAELRRAVGGEESARATPARSGFRILYEVSYLRNLGLLVLLGTIAATLIDYVFKARATAAFEGGESLIRFFAIFYTSVSLITFLVQALLGRASLENLGLVRTVATLPATVVLGSMTALLTPGVVVASGARGMESVMRSSLFRSGYELFFTPVLAEEKRATKTIIDVGFERLGDALGAGLVQLTLFLVAAPLIANNALLAISAAIGCAGLFVANRLHRGWVTALEKSLLEKGQQLEPSDTSPMVSAVMQTVAAIQLSRGDLPVLAPQEPPQRGDRWRALETQVAMRLPRSQRAVVEAHRAASKGAPWPATTGAGLARAISASRQAAAAALPADPDLVKIADLKSGDPARVRRVLHGGPLSPELVSHAIPLLAWEEVSNDGIKALRQVADRNVGQITDALLDPDMEFAIRRRLPRTLTRIRSSRAVDGLLEGLNDRRFEVRFQCGQALAIMRDRHPQISIAHDRVLAVIRREVEVGKGVWESQRLLDKQDSTDSWSLVDEFIKQRTSLSLQHVFTMLSLILAREPLRIAYRGLLTDDQALRGTALEYLESVLPVDIRQRLWPYLTDSASPKAADAKPREEILADLMDSHQSIELNLARLREKYARPPEQA